MELAKKAGSFVRTLGAFGLLTLLRAPLKSPMLKVRPAFFEVKPGSITPAKEEDYLGSRKPYKEGEVTVENC